MYPGLSVSETHHGNAGVQTNQFHTYHSGQQCMHLSSQGLACRALGCTTGRNTYIDTRIYRIRKLSETGEVKIYKVAGENQSGDIFTKSFPRPVFEKHRSSLMAERPYP